MARLAVLPRCAPPHRCITAGAREGAPGEGTAHQLAALAVWLRARGVDLSRTRFVRTAGAGCGLVAARDAGPGATLLRLPLEQEKQPAASASVAWAAIALTSELPLATGGPLGAAGRALAAVDGVARLRDACGSTAPGVRFGKAFDPVQVALLAVALLHERAAGAAAYFQPYAALLPRSLDVPALWNDQQLAALAGSPIGAAASARAAAVAAVHAALLPHICAADPAAFPPAACSLPAFAWAHATVLARAFDVPELGLMAMAPGLDLSNHGAPGADHVGTVELTGSEALPVTASARVGAGSAPALVLRAGTGGAVEGEPLLHAYAGAAAGEALLEYGFVDGVACAAAPAPSLVVLDLQPLLEAAPSVAAQLAAPGARLAALHAAGLCAPLRRFEASSVGVAGLAPSCKNTDADAAAGEIMLPRSALRTARALTATPAELAAAAQRGDGFAAPLSADAEARALAALLQRVHAAQQAYTASVAAPPLPILPGFREDEAQRRARLAAVVVHGEQRVLEALDAALTRRLACAHAGACYHDDAD